jgi:hypothetical protein
VLRLRILSLGAADGFCAKIAANKAAVDAATARFGQLDDYYIMDEVAVYFGNGQTKVDPKYVPQLTTLAQNPVKSKAT